MVAPTSLLRTMRRFQDDRSPSISRCATRNCAMRPAPWAPAWPISRPQADEADHIDPEMRERLRASGLADGHRARGVRRPVREGRFAGRHGGPGGPGRKVPISTRCSRCRASAATPSRSAATSSRERWLPARGYARRDRRTGADRAGRRLGSQGAHHDGHGRRRRRGRATATSRSSPTPATPTSTACSAGGGRGLLARARAGRRRRGSRSSIRTRSSRRTCWAT